MEQQRTAACLIVKSWQGHRVGTRIVLDYEKAKRFEALGVLEVILPPAGEGRSDAPAAPMKDGRSRRHGA